MLWMDILRGAAILAVVTFHSVTIVEKYNFEAGKLWRNLNETLTLFRIPILIFLSGMLLPKSLAKPKLSYFYRKVCAILWPFLLWSTIYGVVTGVHFSSPYELRQLYTGGSHLWFLLFIFIYYLVAKPLKSINPLIVAGGAFILAFISPDGEKYSERLFFLMALFFLGSAVYHYTDQIGKVLRSPWIWLLTPLVAASAFLTVRNDLNFGPYWFGVSSVGFLFFSAIAQRLEATAISKPLIWIGQRSLVFYVSHAIFIIITAKIAERADITSYAYTALLSIVFSLAGGWALAAGGDKWAPIGWIFNFPAKMVLISKPRF